MILKIGPFTFSEQDLVIPVNGLPLTVVRTYDSMNPKAGDFGYSWTYAINEMDVALYDVRATENPLFEDEEGPGPGGSFTRRTGGSRDVTLTLPDGRRTTFYYYEKAGSCTDESDETDAPLCAIPAYQAAPGVTAKLRPVNQYGYDLRGYDLLTRSWQDQGDTFGRTSGPLEDDEVDPHETFDFPGFILTLADGTEFYLPRDHQGTFHFLAEEGNSGDNTKAGMNRVSAYGQARLAEIRQRSGDKIVINTNSFNAGAREFSVDHYNASNVLTRSIYFVRDDQGRIAEIRDPISQLSTNGPQPSLAVVKYEYDNANNLSKVLKLVNRSPATYTTNTYFYENSNFPHYLTKILDARGVPVARNLYDEQGRLYGVIDANGKTNLFQHDLNGRVETVFDRMGNRTLHYYDARGNVTTTIDANGKASYLAYDAANRVRSITDALTNTTYFEYDSNGNQTQAVDPLNHTNLFSYDDNGNLLTHTDPIGNLTVNTYDAAGNLTNSIQKDAHGNTVGGSASVYQNGQLTATRDVNGLTMASFLYDPSGNLTNTIDANGAKRSFTYDGNGNQTISSFVGTNTAGAAVTLSTTNVYDAARRVIQAIDALGKTNFTFYNAIGKADYTIDRFGNTNSFLYDARGNLIRTISSFGTNFTVYDDNAWPILTAERGGVTSTRTYYDAVARVTDSVRVTNVVINLESDPNNAGQYVSIISSAGTPIATNSTEFFDNNWVKSRTGPDGAKTSYEYWEDGKTKTVTDALNHRTHYFHDEAGRQIAMVDALSQITRFEYDALGRQVTTIFPDGSSITNEYNLTGQRTGQVDQAKLRTEFRYNLSGALTNVLKPQVVNPENSYALETPEWRYRYDEQGRLLVITDPKGRSTTNTVDEFGRVVTHWLTLGQTNWTRYDAFGRVSEQGDFKGQKKVVRYDPFGRVATNFYFAAGASYPSNSTSYLYNKLGQLTNIIERTGTEASGGYAWLGGGGDELMAGRARHSVRAVLLASLGLGPPGTWGGLAAVLLCVLALSCIPRAKRQQFALALREAWRAQLLSLSALGGEGRGEVVRFRKRLLPSYSWRFASVVTVIALIGCDPAFNSLWTANAACNIPANLSTETERITTLSYDSEGRLAQVNSPEGVINYEYDLATGRHTRTCTTNSETAYGYDALGRLKAVTLLKRNGTTLSEPEVTTYTYTAVGSRASVSLPDGVVTTWQYDNLNRLTNMVNKAGGTLVSQFSYQLHPTGRRTNAVEILKQEDGSWQTNTLSWAFDGLYRLTNEVCVSTVSGASYTNQFQHDKAGNRWSQVKIAASGTTTITNQYNANDQLLKEVILVGGVPTATNDYAYDANGSLIAKTNLSSGSYTQLYGYDLKNKMSSATTVGSGVTNYFTYNDQGIRVRAWSSAGGSPKLYLVDGNNHTGYAQVLEELTTVGGTPTRSYVIGDDVLAQAATTASYLLYDGHGSTRQLVNADGEVTSRYNYDAYGVTLGTSSTPETSLLYCGEQYDSDLGMYNLRARYYNPATGTFNQRDTFAGNNFDPQSLHKYAFAHCDPISNTDPSGQFIGSLIDVLVTMFIRVSFEVARFVTTYAPAIARVTTVAGYTMLISALYLAMEEAGFVPRTGFTAQVLAISSLVFTLGLSAQVLALNTSGIVNPVRNTPRGQGEIINGKTANQRYFDKPSTSGHEPPYRPASLASEGKISPDSDLVRVFSSQQKNMEGNFTMLRSDVQGLAPAEIQNKWSLTYLPDSICDVRAAGLGARVGIAAENSLGMKGGGIQVQLLEKATFVYPRPIGPGGAQ